MTDHFGAFASTVEDRLRQGAKSYGDLSFQQAPDVLAGEIEQELLDVCEWSFILGCRLRGLRGALRRTFANESERRAMSAKIEVPTGLTAAERETSARSI